MFDHDSLRAADINAASLRIKVHCCRNARSKRGCDKVGGRERFASSAVVEWRVCLQSASGLRVDCLGMQTASMFNFYSNHKLKCYSELDQTPKKVAALRVVCVENVSRLVPRATAIAAAVSRTNAGSQRFPRNGTGAR